MSSSILNELDILKDMGRVMEERREGYFINTIDLLEVEDWLSQIVIKAYRAKLATNNDKLKDELLDTANYCVLLLARIQREEMESCDISLSSQ